MTKILLQLAALQNMHMSGIFGPHINPNHAVQSSSSRFHVSPRVNGYHPVRGGFECWNLWPIEFRTMGLDIIVSMMINVACMFARSIGCIDVL